VTWQVGADNEAGRLREAAAALRRRGASRLVIRTAGFNIASTAAAGLGGIIVARVLGPELRGEYAAVTAWFGISLMVGSMGQPAALCFYVAKDPGLAREYVATSRAMMLVTGTAALVGGILLAPLLAHGNAELTVAYRIVFSASIIAFIGASYTFSLQARNLRWWNTVRVSQPVLSLVLMVVLWRLRLLTLTAVLIVLVLTMLVQLGWAYYRCRAADLVPGRAQARLVRPLAAYGVSQIAALTPAAVNKQLDQLVLSQAVPLATLGRYAIAVSCTLLPIPLVAAIGNVAFPKLASLDRVDGLVQRMQWLAIIGSGCAAACVLVPLALVAPWLIPRVFGPGYGGVVPLLWLLTPAGVFLACNQVTGDVLRGRKRPLVVARAEGLAAVFTVILLVALLPVFGVYGAAIASTVAYGIALFMMLWSLRTLPADSSGPRHRRQSSRRRPISGGVVTPAIRRAVALTTDLACRLMGRHTVIRATRYVLSRARLDSPSETPSNGGSALQRWACQFSEPGEPIHVADVGANIGRWSQSMLAAASQTGRDSDLQLHVFEPDVQAFALLATTLNGRRARLVMTSLGDRQVISPSHAVAPASGMVRISPVYGTNPTVQQKITLDWYSKQAGVAHFALVRIDAEGHDLAVMRGARRLLTEHRITAIQFKYGRRWIFAHFFLRDVFEFLQPLGYRIGKLSPRGVEFYSTWDADLETFVESNYVACDQEAAAGLPTGRGGNRNEGDLRCGLA